MIQYIYTIAVTFIYHTSCFTILYFILEQLGFGLHIAAYLFLFVLCYFFISFYFIVRRNIGYVAYRNLSLLSFFVLLIFFKCAEFTKVIKLQKFGRAVVWRKK